MILKLLRQIQMNNKESSLTESVINESVKLEGRDAEKYIWSKIKDYDEFTGDDSKYWEIEETYGLDGDMVIVTSLKDLPRDAKYRFSMSSKDGVVDINVYTSYDEDKAYFIVPNANLDEAFIALNEVLRANVTLEELQRDADKALAAVKNLTFDGPAKIIDINTDDFSVTLNNNMVQGMIEDDFRDFGYNNHYAYLIGRNDEAKKRVLLDYLHAYLALEMGLAITNPETSPFIEMGNNDGQRNSPNKAKKTASRDLSTAFNDLITMLDNKNNSGELNFISNTYVFNLRERRASLLTRRVFDNLIKGAYEDGYSEGYQIRQDAIEQRRQDRKVSKDAIRKTFIGNSTAPEDLAKLKALMDWIAEYVDRIDFTVGYAQGGERWDGPTPRQEISDQDTCWDLEELTSRGKIKNDYKVYKQGLYPAYKLKLKPEAKDNIPDGVDTWSLIKTSNQDPTGTMRALAYKKDTNCITGNGLIRDLLFNDEYQHYGFMVG